MGCSTGFAAPTGAAPPARARLEGATSRRRLRGWNPPLENVNALVASGGPKLLARARELVVTNGYAANACEAFAANALTTKMRLRDALRHILLGGLIAAGMGSLAMAIIAAWLRLPPEVIPAGRAAGSAAYLVGVFGPAFIEVVLARLRAAKGRKDD